MKYIKTYFAFICSFLLMFSSLLSPVVRASEMEKSASNIRKESTVEVVEGSTGNLFEEVNSIHSGIVHTFVDGDFLITELLGEDDTVLVTKVINQKTGETLTTTSSSEATVVIEKTTINDNEYASEREI
ncbi:hypothetical protein ACVRWQ_04385 [Streptococcus phocae subsp. salmonis]|uniref:hypothetical protein n=1 Tax=Streptococcus phocae TaxID=119224 RepID=UPI000531ECF6|nr:hypothetical protein [Streptococcus phocae]KGR72437.1 hypothetical protein NX86_06150 [Streptococcus phocae subsp. salmonis]